MIIPKIVAEEKERLTPFVHRHAFSVHNMKLYWKNRPNFRIMWWFLTDLWIMNKSSNKHGRRYPFNLFLISLRRKWPFNGVWLNWLRPWLCVFSRLKTCDDFVRTNTTQKDFINWNCSSKINFSIWVLCGQSLVFLISYSFNIKNNVYSSISAHC